MNNDLVSRLAGAFTDYRARFGWPATIRMSKDTQTAMVRQHNYSTAHVLNAPLPDAGRLKFMGVPVELDNRLSFGTMAVGETVIGASDASSR